MKTKTLYIALFISLFTISIKAQEAISISGTKFTYPLIERWINEYTKENPQAKILLVKKKNESSKIDISVIAHQPLNNEVSSSQKIVYIGKYALLPITTKNNVIFKNIKKRGLNKSEYEKLFFEEGIFEESSEDKKYPVTIYARESQSCTALTFASYFGYKSNEIRGKKIAGDEIYLLSSIKRDTTGVTYNVLGNIYDTQTRKLKDDLALLPLDIGKEASSALNNNVDDVLKLLENQSFETIPVEKIGFVYSSSTYNKELVKFLKWTLSDGQKYIHEFGYLNLDKDVIANQQENLDEQYLTNK
jgi:phosphate transport system substrate-binding protein